MAKTTKPTTRRMLAILRELCVDLDPLRDCYGIDLEHPIDVPLDRAIAAWRQAGYPDALEATEVEDG